MLSFEFVQPSEFEDPYYSIIEDGEVYGDDGEIGVLVFDEVGKWFVRFRNGWIHDSDTLITVAAKLRQLNKSTESQRILGVF